MSVPRLFQEIAADLLSLARRIDDAGLLGDRAEIGVHLRQPPETRPAHLRISLAALLADPRRADSFPEAPRLRVARHGSVRSVVLESLGRRLAIATRDGVPGATVSLTR